MYWYMLSATRKCTIDVLPAAADNELHVTDFILSAMSAEHTLPDVLQVLNDHCVAWWCLCQFE